jgi:radical SAM superfamily enzyme YgiQ (UPF0313 family)
MKVLLVYPEFPDTFWSFKHALKFIRKKASSPPLGLLTVAAMLPPDWEIRLADLNIGPLSSRDLEWADAAFISAMVVQRDSARRAIALCKQAGIMVVAGGPLFTTEYANFSEVDTFVLNEAEITLPDFLADLERGQVKRIYTTDQFPDIYQTPAPRWDLVDFKNYATMDLQFSRGCPYNCEFCNITVLFGRRPRTKTAAQLIGELDGLYKLGWRGGIFFVDDNFIGNKKLLKSEILPALIRWRQGKSGLSFSTEVSINLADDDELVEMMARAGFTTVFIGIETPDENSLAECNKFQNTGRDLVASVKRLQRAGIQVQGGFIVGFDSDKPSIFQRQIDFIQQSGIVSAMVGLLQAPYGTPLYRRLKAEGRILTQLSGDNVDGSTNIIPKMDIQVLRSGYARLLEHIYAPAFFYERVITFLKEYKPPKMRVHFEMDYLYALWRSIYVLGIRGVERVQFWKLWAWVLVHRPKLFPQAITLAIYGYHFRQICLLASERKSPAYDG